MGQPVDRSMFLVATGKGWGLSETDICRIRKAKERWLWLYNEGPELI